MLYLLYWLFSVHHWGLADLRALYEDHKGWQEIIGAFAAYGAERRRDGFAW